MNKLDMKSEDIINDNIEYIKEKFPNVVVESENGYKIDFNALKQELSDVIVDETKEKYQSTWPGKKEAIIIANTPTTKTLRPLREKSSDFDKTKNIYIEGDNLDALKILQESYLGKIKCIYIDPPYNTGNDFIYNDKFAKSEKQELIESGRMDEDGYIFTSKDINNEAQGNFHSDWLSMMYPRLKLARNLLSPNGVIFISIDDNELANLKKICDEIFGEKNFINTIAINMSNLSGPKIQHAIMGKRFPKIKEYLLIYVKNTDKYRLNIPKKMKRQWDEEYNLIIPEFKKDTFNILKRINIKEANNIVKNYNIVSLKKYMKENHIPETDIKWKKDNSFRIFSSKPNTALLNKASEVEKFSQKLYFISNSSGQSKMIKTDFNRETKTARIELVSAEENASIFLGDQWGDIVTTGGIAHEGSVTFNNGKKPLKLLKRIINLVSNDEETIILDFFSGSASTAHAVMQLNAEDKGNRKYIMVQLQEKCDEKSEAYTAGYKTICDLGEERIRISAKKIEEETDANIDYGFRVYKIDSSNMKDVYYKPSELQQEQLNLFESNIKDDRTPEDLLTQVILDLGLTLDLKIIEKNILGNKVYFVDENSLVACFDDNLNINIINEICKCNPLKVVFKDSSFKADNDKINVEERIKKLSPETELNIL